MRPYWLALAFAPADGNHKAETIPASGATPAHCSADGTVNERTGAGGKTFGIGFAIALPDNRNNRFLFQGGGGYNGSVRPPLGEAGVGEKTGLARGFAVVSTDSGHKGSTFDRSYDADQTGQPRFCAGGRCARDRAFETDRRGLLRAAGGSVWTFALMQE